MAQAIIISPALGAPFCIQLSISCVFLYEFAVDFGLPIRKILKLLNQMFALTL